MSLKYKIPRGTFDILPTESFKWQFITKVFRENAKNFNFREIVTPIFESAGLYERSVGNTSDIVQKEMYKFTDKKGRVFALRPEGTAGIVRAYVENNLDMKDNSSKLYYIGPMFRYERPQKGRYRQHYQYGIENIGSSSPFVDAEVISFGYYFLKKLGLTNFKLEINSIGCSNCSQDYNIALVEYYKPFFDDLCQDCKIRIDKNPKRLLDCKVPECKEISQNAPSMLAYLDEDCKEHFKKVQEFLKKINIPFKINPKIVRGLDYYSRTAFEFINTNLGAQNTLIGGGRYDGLVEQIGGKNIPGIGFAGGFERLILSMEAEGVSFGSEQNPDYYLVCLGDKAKDYSLNLLIKIRNAGISIDSDFEKKSIKAQMKAADKSNAHYSLILGDDEISQNKIVLKNMKTGEQELVLIDRLIEKLNSLLPIP